MTSFYYVNDKFMFGILWWVFDDGKYEGKKLNNFSSNSPRFCKSSRTIWPVKFVAGVGGNDKWAGVAPPGYHAHPPDCPLNIRNLS